MSSLRARRIARNPFAFPGGNAAFNPAHPAASSSIISVVTVGNGDVNVFTGTKGTYQNTPTFSVNGIIGPYHTSIAASNQRTEYSIGVQSATAPCTLAGIFVPTASVGSNSYFLSTSSASNGLALGWSSAQVPRLAANGVGIWASTLAAPTVGTPYFFAASSNGSNAVNFIVCNLNTGQYFTSTASNSVSPSANNGTFQYGSATAGGASVNTAAAMYSIAFLPMPVLVAWALDPWSYWYPR